MCIYIYTYTYMYVCVYRCITIPKYIGNIYRIPFIHRILFIDLQIIFISIV